MIDFDGYRPNVGIILSNRRGELLWARRIGQDAWQFPQGGIRRNETPETAMFRELHEELGLSPDHVEILGYTRRWLRYRLPKHLIRHWDKPVCVGQKQVWYLLRLLGGDDHVRLDASRQPEFDSWCWVHYWYPLDNVIAFKRGVYERALREFATYVLPGAAPGRAASETMPPLEPLR